MSVATSSALRFRNREALTAISLIDGIDDQPETIVRLLSDAVSVLDENISTHRILKPGDKIQSFTENLDLTSPVGRILNPPTYPSVVGVGTYVGSTPASVHSANYPVSTVAGQLLLLIASNDGVNTSPFVDGSWSNVMASRKMPNATSGTHGGLIAYKEADGTEGGGTFNVTLDTSEELVVHVLAIDNWDSNEAPTIDAVLIITTGSTMDFPQIDPDWGLANIMLLGVAMWDSDAGPVISWPSGYDDNQTLERDSSCGLVYATKEIRSADEPASSFVMTNSVDYGGMHIAVKAKHETEFLLVEDSLIKTVTKIDNRVLTEFVRPSDDGFITDKDFIRVRGLSDYAQPTDSFDKTVTIGEGAIVSRVRINAVEITDNAIAIKFGTFDHVLSDSITIDDVLLAKRNRDRQPGLDVLDAVDVCVELRERERKTSDQITLSEDILVDRQAIDNEVADLSFVEVTDRVFVTTGSTVPLSAEIEIGIEAQ